ncbi:hypothetical protein [Streptomyces misionensis]|uniref:hypothetical protein n=1 Tax=Streptomyces misionensis TaxID=67331 RepID=UPI0036A1CBEB
MSLNRAKISIKPGGPYADRGTPTTYQPSRGGWYPTEDRPTAGTGGDRTDEGRNSGLTGGGR